MTGYWSHKLTIVLILVAGVLTGCINYYSKFNFRGTRIGASVANHALVIDSDQVRARIHAEELRQADEKRRIRELPPAAPRDSAAAKAWLEAFNKLVDLQARSVFLSDLKAMTTFEIPATARGLVVGASACECTLSTGSYQQLVKVRFRLRAERRVVEGWICEDAIEMLHTFDL